ncbi:hypothetical protein [Blastococcus goldschmidtiae]|uniref:Capsular polysaccharide biosynthesis protein n=1 Tax=Blastococcus goldschmidtiae TaxID=3075546 RepID=A0ABU2KAY2_9ACTN|nr:hypothetical protein [Blastococcus sp. DSM 46792]MDT0277348.1 hypothetical protein [Blastococcus sp. DSM 46792]
MMTLATVLRIMSQHRLLAGFLLVVVAAAASVLYLTAPRQYAGAATLVVVPNQELSVALASPVDVNPATNPFTSAGAANALAGVLQQVLADAVPTDKAVAAGPGLEVETLEVTRDDASISITYDDISRPPYLSIESSASTARGVSQALGVTEDIANERLVELQDDADAPVAQRYRAVIANSAGGFTVTYPDRLRNALGAALVGTVLAVLLVVFRDGRQQSAASRRGNQAGRQRATSDE